jgi:hypothetical protein
MKTKYTFFFFLTLFLFTISNNTQAQETTKIPSFTADSLASGNYQDVLSSFFQLGLKNLTGPNKEFKFSSNIFAFALKINPNLAVDTNYLKYTYLRRLNVNFDGKLDSTNKFNSFAIELKYAIINKRDITVSEQFMADALNNGREIHNLFQLFSTMKNGITDPDLKSKFTEQSTKFFKDTTLTFDQLDKKVQDALISIAKENNLNDFLNLVKTQPHFNAKKFLSDDFKTVKDSFQNKPLWTIGLNYTVDQKINIQTEYLKGILDKDSPTSLELDAKADLEILDTTINFNNVNRKVFNTSLGLNWVIAKNSAQQSIVEFKVAASYKYVWSGLIENENNNVLTADGTFRVRVTKSLWVPIDIKYDPKSGEVFGFLNVVTNFDSFKNVF